MRRIALILALFAFLMGSAGCFAYDCCDYMHPRPRATMPSCDCLPCGERPDYSQLDVYP